MRSCILQVYIRLSSVDSHRRLFRLHVAEHEKRKKKKKEKKTQLHDPNKHSGSVFFLQEGK